jgi:hypothetical protein
MLEDFAIEGEMVHGSVRHKLFADLRFIDPGKESFPGGTLDGGSEDQFSRVRNATNLYDLRIEMELGWETDDLRGAIHDDFG